MRSTKSRRIPRYVVLGVALTVIVVISLVFSHYQPIRSTSLPLTASRVITSSGTPEKSVTSDGVVTWTEPTGTFTVESLVELVNTGSLPITVERVLTPSLRGSPARTYFGSNLDDTAVGVTEGARFFPYTMSARTNLDLAVHWSEQCTTSSASGAFTYVSSLPVITRFFVIRHTVAIPVTPFRIKNRKFC